MNSGWFEGVAGAIEAVGLEKLGERGELCVMGVAGADTRNTPNDRCDEVSGFNRGGGHAKGVANPVPWARSLARSGNAWGGVVVKLKCTI